MIHQHEQRRQRVTCDTCHTPLNGLLAECHRPACLTATNDVERSVL